MAAIKIEEPYGAMKENNKGTTCEIDTSDTDEVVKQQKHIVYDDSTGATDIKYDIRRNNMGWNVPCM